VKIGDITIDPPTVLAPMASITNPPFRQICLEHGAGLAGSEVLSAVQLLLPNKPVPIERATGERVLVVQLYGRSPKIVADGARVAVEHGADVLDLNMGCPARKILKQGAGVALMREPELAQMITQAVVEAIDIPVTVKMRAGYDAKAVNAVEVAQRVVAAGAVAVTIHARLREAVHTGPFDWEIIRQVRDALPPEIPVVGNGGVGSPADALAMRAQTGCDGVMIGRGARGNPWIFESLRDPSFQGPTPAQRQDVMLEHLEAYVTWTGEDRAAKEMRKHLCWYLRGLPGAAKLRNRLSHIRQRRDVIDVIEEIV
jgi:tRNA-dihydrouridine synthase B